MKNPHCQPPIAFGKMTPDGGLLLHPEEAKWLSIVLARIDVAQAEIAIDVMAARDPDFTRYARDRIIHDVARHAAESVTDDDVELLAQTKHDENHRVIRRRAKLTIIRGGLPPRPAF